MESGPFDLPGGLIVEATGRGQRATGFSTVLMRTGMDAAYRLVDICIEMLQPNLFQ